MNTFYGHQGKLCPTFFNAMSGRINNYFIDVDKNSLIFF